MRSYVKGPDFELTSLTTHQAFAETAARFADRNALIVPFQGVRLTWRDLAGNVERTARGLAGLGLVPGDRVGVWSTNCAEWIYLQLACARVGLVLVNVNPAYRTHELRYVLRKSGIKALVLHAADERADYREILEEAARGQELALKHVVYLGEESWDRLLSNAADPGPGPFDCHEVVNIQYTSGTTGSPKGALLTHSNLVNNGRVISHGMRMTDADSICLPVPLYHCFGCVDGTMVSLASGAAMVLPSPRFDALAAMQAIHEERATAIYGVPTMFIAILDHEEFPRFNFTSLRTGIMGGAPCPIEVMRRIVTEMHCPQMAIMYGQTETSPNITMVDVDDPLELRISTVGRVCPATELKIAAYDGSEAPAGQPGEVCVRGYLVMKGYDQEPEATARAIDSDGWLHTGDVGVLRPDEYVRLTGRLKDLIIRGGENIYPREVEDFLFTHPKIAEVQVIGIPDEKLGECVAAWVRLRPGETAEEKFRSIECGRRRLKNAGWLPRRASKLFEVTNAAILSRKRSCLSFRQWFSRPRPGPS